jgi:hypothetical protein
MFLAESKRSAVGGVICCVCYCLLIFEFEMSMDDSGEEDCTVYIE